MSHDAGFGTIGVSPDLCEALAEQGIEAPFAIQTLVMPAALCTSELVTNVHLHTKGSTMVRLRLAPARLRAACSVRAPATRPRSSTTRSCGRWCAPCRRGRGPWWCCATTSS